MISRDSLVLNFAPTTITKLQHAFVKISNTDQTDTSQVNAIVKSTQTKTTCSQELKPKTMQHNVISQ